MAPNGRIELAVSQLEKHRFDAVLVGHLPNIRYLCGFTGSAGLLLIGRAGDAHFFTDGRYTEQSREEVQGARVHIRKGTSALASAADWLKEHSGFKRLGIEPAHTTVADRDVLARRLAGGTRLVNAPPFVEQMRMIKSPEEVARIRAACRVGDRLFTQLVKAVQPLVTESQVAGQLEFAALEAGVTEMAFPTIIAAGKRSALPHGRASSNLIPRRGFVVCDFGVILSGYCSDMTRTLHVGRPSTEARRVYEAVQEAQQAALGMVRPGNTVGEVDSAARKLLHKRGLGRYFTHSTGHGVGLEIHEAPRVAVAQTEVLRSGMVITVEPGVYLPGRFGVRIEDTVAVTKGGVEILTMSPKELLWN